MCSKFFIYPIAILFCSRSSKNAKKPVKPGIIFMLADNRSYGALGCFGPKTIKTPEIDKTVPLGLKFINHYAGNMVYVPSQSGISTVG